MPINSSLTTHHTTRDDGRSLQRALLDADIALADAAGAVHGDAARPWGFRHQLFVADLRRQRRDA